MRTTGSNESNDGADCNPHPPDAGFTAHHVGLPGNAIQHHLLHDQILSMYENPSAGPALRKMSEAGLGEFHKVAAVCVFRCDEPLIVRVLPHGKPGTGGAPRALITDSYVCPPSEIHFTS